MSFEHPDSVSDVSDDDGWTGPEAAGGLRAGAVQLWRLDLSCPEGAAWIESGWDLLAPAEVERARRMRAGMGRDEFIAGRGALRRLLARELSDGARGFEQGLDPREVTLRMGAHGKPAVDACAGACGRGRLEFNLAHSGGMILIAMSRAGTVGIDVEDPAREVEALEIARTNFHPDEVAWIESREAEERRAAFYRVWTRKEAVAKADGRGLMLLSSSYSVCPRQGRCAAELTAQSDVFLSESCAEMWEDMGSIRYKWGRAFPGRYSVRAFHPGRGLVGALALTERNTPIERFNLRKASDCGWKLERGEPWRLKPR